MGELRAPGAPMPEASYFLDNYGACALDRCECLKPGNQWLGRGCLHWQPTECRSFDELILRAMNGRAR